MSMNRRDFLHKIGKATAGLAGSGVLLKLLHGCSAQDDKKWNIVFILSDDQAWGDYSFMNHPHIQTPHIDQLAKE